MSLSPAASRHGAQLGIPPPSRAPPRAVLHPAPRRHAPCSCPVAVGRDVFARGGSPLAPPHRIACGGSPPRCVAWQVAHAESFAGASPCAPYRLPGLPARAGRGVRSPHPRPCRGTAPPPTPGSPPRQAHKKTGCTVVHPVFPFFWFSGKKTIRGNAAVSPTTSAPFRSKTSEEQ